MPCLAFAKLGLGCALFLQVASNSTSLPNFLATLLALLSISSEVSMRQLNCGVFHITLLQFQSDSPLRMTTGHCAVSHFTSFTFLVTWPAGKTHEDTARSPAFHVMFLGLYQCYHFLHNYPKFLHPYSALSHKSYALSLRCPLFNPESIAVYFLSCRTY